MSVIKIENKYFLDFMCYDSGEIDIMKPKHADLRYF